jgi:hypothetical protein
MSPSMTIDAKGLEALLVYKKESTIKKDARRNPKSLPPSIQVGKGRIWFRQIALNWMAGEACDHIEIFLTSVYLDADGLAAILLVKEASTILQDVSRNSSSLPPIFRQGKKPVWLLLDVLKWLAARSSEPLEIILKSPRNYPSGNPSISLSFGGMAISQLAQEGAVR